jgi:hypothetical protein
MVDMPPRLVCLKEKTLGWRFRVIHIPGVKLCRPDALSRAIAPQGDVQIKWSLPYPATEEIRGISTPDYWSGGTISSNQGVQG